jgi:hypothetical protein
MISKKLAWAYLPDSFITIIITESSPISILVLNRGRKYSCTYYITHLIAP